MVVPLGCPEKAASLCYVMLMTAQQQRPAKVEKQSGDIDQQFMMEKLATERGFDPPSKKWCTYSSSLPNDLNREPSNDRHPSLDTAGRKSTTDHTRGSLFIEQQSACLTFQSRDVPWL